MNNLIIGANSFLGKEICKQLLIKKNEIVAVYNKNTDNLLENIRSISIKEMFLQSNNYDIIYIVSAYIPKINDDNIEEKLQNANVNLVSSASQTFTFALSDLSQSSLGLINEVKVSQRCYNPKELVDLIAEFSGIISHRLHANIVANALGIPSVALTWDKKVQSYFDLIDRGDCCFKDTSPPNEIVARLRCALQEGISEESLARLKKTSLEKLKEQIGLA